MADLVDAARAMAREQTLRHGKALLEDLKMKYTQLRLKWHVKLESMVRAQYQKDYDEAIAGLRRKLASLDKDFQQNTDTALQEGQGEFSADYDGSQAAQNANESRGSKVKTSAGSVPLLVPSSPADFDENICKRLESKCPEGGSPGAHWILNKARSPAVAIRRRAPANGSSSRHSQSNNTGDVADIGPPSKLPKLFHDRLPPHLTSLKVILPPSSDSSSTDIQRQQADSTAYPSTAIYSPSAAAPTDMQHPQQATDDSDWMWVGSQDYQNGVIDPNWTLIVPPDKIELHKEQASVTQSTPHNQKRPRGSAQVSSARRYKRRTSDAFPEDEAAAEILTGKRAKAPHSTLQSSHGEALRPL